MLNSRCATSGRCYPHGTEMAGTIGGRMNNGIGVVGVAPHSRLIPIVISQVDRGLLARLSTIAEGIDAAVAGERRCDQHKRQVAGGQPRNLDGHIRGPSPAIHWASGWW